MAKSPLPPFTKGGKGGPLTNRLKKVPPLLSGVTGIGPNLVVCSPLS